MRRYRYRTAVLVGPWRNSDAEAKRDAATAGQIVFEEGTGNFRWVVPGRIEEADISPQRKQRARRA